MYLLPAQSSVGLFASSAALKTPTGLPKTAFGKSVSMSLDTVSFLRFSGEEQKQATLAELVGKMPAKRLYGPDDPSAVYNVGFPMSPTPYAITQEEHRLFQKLGPALTKFIQATNTLYFKSLKDPALDWVRELYEQGKPPELLPLFRARKARQHSLSLYRPDFLKTDEGFKLVEINALPCGIGIAGAMRQAYEQLGFEGIVGTKEPIPAMYLRMLKALAPQGKTEPEIAILVSESHQDFWNEIEWLVDQIKPTYDKIHMVRPEQLALQGDVLGVQGPGGGDDFTPIDVMYRYFGIYELETMPNIELIQKAVKKGTLVCAPPLKPHLEEKLSLALIHHPMLAPFWLDEMGREAFKLVQSVVPETWVLDPTPVPAHAAVVPPLMIDGIQHRDFTGLEYLSRKLRHLVLKLSGFSRMADRSRSVVLGHNLGEPDWKEALERAFDSFRSNPYVLQKFHKPVSEPYGYYDLQTGKLIDSKGRTRFAPCYFVEGKQTHLVGVLATTCPQKNEIIHGMDDGAMRPAMVVNSK